MNKKCLLRTFITILAIGLLSSCKSENEAPSAFDQSEADSSAVSTEIKNTPETNTDTVSTEESQDVPEAQSEEVNMDSARLTYMVKEYTDNSIVEIPYIEYDEKEANPEIDSINRSLNQGIRQIYEDFISEDNESFFIEIRTYPFTSDDYLQAVVTYCRYPIYGTDGDMFSINYDRKAGKALSVSDAMNELGIDQSEVEKNIERLIKPEFPNQLIKKLSVTGFLAEEDEDGTHIKLLLEITEEIDDNPESRWKRFYSYVPELDELQRLEKEQLFAPLDLDPISD